MSLTRPIGQLTPRSVLWLGRSLMLVPYVAFLVCAGCVAKPMQDDQKPSSKGEVLETDLGAVISDTPFKISIPENAIGFHVVVEVDGSLGTEQIGLKPA